MPPKELFCFESADFLQIGKSVCMAPKVDVFPFHIMRELRKMGMKKATYSC